MAPRPRSFAGPSLPRRLFLVATLVAVVTQTPLSVGARHCGRADLDLEANWIDPACDADLYVKEGVFAHVKRWVTFGMVDTRWGDTEVVALVKTLRARGAVITGLWLDRNLVGDTGAMVLASLLEGPAGAEITALGLHGNKIGESGSLAIARAVARPSSKVAALSMVGNPMGRKGAETIAKVSVLADRRPRDTDALR